MSSPLSYPPVRPNRTNIVAACILSGGLIIAATIDSHRPVISPLASLGMATAAFQATPPIAQEAAQQQFEAQIAGQKLAPLRLNGVAYFYKGVNILEVNYSAKDDSFTFLYNPQWQSSTGARDKDLDSLTSASATNDGYGHYTGGANMGTADGGEYRYAHFTIR